MNLMKKLDNKGFGLVSVIVIGCIFILILIFLSIRISSMKKNNKNNKSEQASTQVTDVTLYKQVEKTLQDAGESYVIYHDELSDYSIDFLIVNYSTLKEEEMIKSLADPNSDKPCDGFVKINNDGTVEPFIKCKNYTTNGYNDWI